MATRTCSKETNLAQAAIAVGESKMRKYAPVMAHIESVNTATREVSFSAKGSAKIYKTSWEVPQIRVECPTTIASQNGLPEPQSDGILFMGPELFAKLDQGASQLTRLKWPIEEALEPGADAGSHGVYQPLELSASSVQITANDPKHPGHLTFDLFEAGVANQTLDLSRVYTELHVKNHRSGEVHSMRLKVLRAVMHATCIATGILNTLDLLNPFMSDAFQIIDLTNRSQISSLLSQRGMGLFGLGQHA